MLYCKAGKIVIGNPNTIQINVSDYFLPEEMVNYLKVKNVCKCFTVKWLKS